MTHAIRIAVGDRVTWNDTDEIQREGIVVSRNPGDIVIVWSVCDRMETQGVHVSNLINWQPREKRRRAK